MYLGWIPFDVGVHLVVDGLCVILRCLGPATDSRRKMFSNGATTSEINNNGRGRRSISLGFQSSGMIFMWFGLTFSTLVSAPGRYLNWPACSSLELDSQS